MIQERRDFNEENEQSEKDTVNTGSDLPTGDGTVSDEDVHKITDDRSGEPTGKDHSTENYEESEPSDGVGVIQNASDTSSAVAHLKD